MKYDHDVLIATTCPDGEATTVISVHLADEILIYMYLYEWDAMEEG